MHTSSDICLEEICTYVMGQEGTREYLAIPKGRGFVYAHANQLYKRVKTEGRTKYLKCSKVGCDGSSKIIDDMFFLGVCTYLFDFLTK